MTAPADSRISDERLDELLADPDFAQAVDALETKVIRALITELRERRAQAVTATLYVEQRSLDDMPPGGQHYIQARKQPGGNFAVPLYAAPPPAQAAFIETRNESAGFTEYVLEDETTVSRRVTNGELLMSLDRTRVVGFRAYDAPPAQAAGVTPTHRHKKRGTEYVLIGYGKMQAENWEEREYAATDEPSPGCSVDMREVAIYRSVDDGSLWARPKEEFKDGRFVSLSREE